MKFSTVVTMSVVAVVAYGILSVAGLVSSAPIDALLTVVSHVLVG
jgi:hypothetical protein